MSTIRAKQQICLNISTIRCLSTYSSGRYCLRFYIYQINNNVQQMSGSSMHGHYHSKYATPVSVMEYKNNIIPPSPYCNPAKNNKIQSNQSIYYEINQHIYSTKPFLLKPNQQTPIYQLCIFKHDINIFNNKYQNDYHQITMHCHCELVSIEYSSNGEGRVVGTFEGRIKGAGINDALLIDFYEGVAVQVKGSVHSCVYQFQYIYTGGPIKKYINNNTNINNSNINENRATKNRSSKQQREKAKIFDNKYYSKVYENTNQNNNKIGNTNISNINNANINENSVIITNMTFDMYCEMQSKQYVQSLLQYLLNEVKKSEDKVNMNLSIFQTIKQADATTTNNVSNSIYNSINSINNVNNNKLIQQYNNNTYINNNIPTIVVHSQPNSNIQQQQLGNLKILTNLQQSIRSQSGIDKNQAINPITKQRLSIIKQYSNTQNNNNNNNSNGNGSNGSDNGSVQLQIDEQDRQQYSNCNMDQVINSINANNSNFITNMDSTTLNNKIQLIEDDDCILLDDQQPQHLVQQCTTHNKINNSNRKINVATNKQEQQSKQVQNIKNMENYSNIVQNNSNILKQQSQSQVKRKRKKIFVQSSNPNSIPKTNININIINNTKTNNNNNNNNNKIENKYKTQKNKAQSNKYQAQQLKIQLQQLQFSNKQSFFGDREIPVSNTQMHPNHLTNAQQYTNCNSNIKNNENNKISKVTIQQFQQILHSNCLIIYEKWRKFINFLTQPEVTILLTAYHNDYNKKLLSLLNQSIIRFKGSFDIDIYSKQQSQRNKMAYQIRQQTMENQKNIMINQFRFYNKSLFCKYKPIMFQQNFVKANYQNDIQSEKNNKKFIKVSLTHNNNNIVTKHLIILVHGLGACRLDMQKIKLQLKRYCKQKVHIVSSSSNQGRTEGDINMMGVRLAHQADQQISKFYDNLQDNECMKVSFFGHSMGGVIIRSALPRLQKYKKYFHSFMTLSSPHVGYTYSSSKLVDVGLWLINNWKKCQSILQLTMSDQNNSNNTNTRNKNTNNMQNTFLYKLSQQKGLEWFKKITFLASRQDLYVPYFSARVQKHDQCLSDLKSKSQYAVMHAKMIDNILSRVTGSVTRIDVNFCITEQSVDNLIGRTAHIHFVNNIQFIRLLVAADQATII